MSPFYEGKPGEALGPEYTRLVLHREPPPINGETMKNQAILNFLAYYASDYLEMAGNEVEALAEKVMRDFAKEWHHDKTVMSLFEGGENNER